MRRQFFLLGIIVATTTNFWGCSAIDPNPPSGDANVVNAIAEPQKYILVLNNIAVQMAEEDLGKRVSSSAIVNAMMRDLSIRYELEPAEQVYSVTIKGGVYELSEAQAQALAADPAVKYLERDQPVHLNFAQASAPWGLDRIDQSALPLNQVYVYPDHGTTVNAYIIDTGILLSHNEFQGRALTGIDLVSRGGQAIDCNGHGTHVAGTVGGATYGVAKNVNLYAVRVLDCNGSGSFSNVIAGIEWVTANHRQPAVVNMSLGGGVSQAVDDAVAASVRSGVTYVVAAGNDSTLACNSSPSRVPTAITVGSATRDDVRSSFSNYGSCVDIFAPGSDILSSWFSSSSATNTISGTSMATPHVAGVAALYLAQHPDALPSEVSAQIVSHGIQGRIANTGSGSPNLLVNTSFLISASDGGGGPLPSPSPQPTPPDNGNGPAPCAGCSKVTGSLSAVGEIVNIPNGKGYASGAGLQQFWLSGPSSADLDLHLYKKKGNSWTEVASSVSTSSTELISYQGTRGTYLLRVHAYSGSGGFTVWQKSP